MYDLPDITNELSHIAPASSPEMVPEVDVCDAVSLLANVTVPPAGIVAVDGMKQFGSHPDVEEPCAFSTTTFMCPSANADGIIIAAISTVTYTIFSFNPKLRL